EAPVDQLEGKLLEDVVAGVRFAQHLAQVAVDRPAVALEQLLPGGVRGLGGAVMRPGDERPARRGPGEPFVGGRRLQTANSCHTWRFSRKSRMEGQATRCICCKPGALPDDR